MEKMLGVLQHTLGLDQYGRGRHYRNHFVAGGSNLEICRHAVSQGLMVERESTPISGGSPWFSVTQSGIDFVALNSPAPPPPTKRTRSQARYRRYLTYGDMFSSFIEFCRWDAEPERSWN